MKTLFLKACEYCVQQVNGRQSLVGVFDSIVTPQIPVDHPPFFICLQVEFDAEEEGKDFHFLLRLIDDDGKRLLELPVQCAAPKDPVGGIARVFVSFHVPGLRIERTGEYRLDFLANGQKQGEERIPILLASPQLPA